MYIDIDKSTLILVYFVFNFDCELGDGDGVKKGTSVSDFVGVLVGAFVGVSVGTCIGALVGASVSTLIGVFVGGSMVGAKRVAVSNTEGDVVGDTACNAD